MNVSPLPEVSVSLDDGSVRSRPLRFLSGLTTFEIRGGASSTRNRAITSDRGTAMAVETRVPYWYQVRDGTMSRWKFRRVMKTDVIEPFEELLLMGGFCGESSLENSCCNLYLMSKALWTFVRREGVEPTNNTAEQSLRHAVIWRKTSFGTQSEKGSRFVERILTLLWCSSL